MKYTIGALLAVVAFAPLLLAADSGVFFKDDPLGMSLADFCARYDRKVGDDPRRAPMLRFGKVDFSTFPTIGPATSYRTTKKVVAEKNFPYEKSGGRVPGIPETIAGVPAEATYEFFAESIADWDVLAQRQQTITDALSPSNQKSVQAMKDQLPWAESPPGILSAASRFNLGAIVVSFAASDFNLVMVALKEKYGPPGSETAGTLQAKTGEKLPSRRFHWVLGQDQIDAAELPTVSYVQVRFYRQAIIDRASGRTTKQIEDASKDL